MKKTLKISTILLIVCALVSNLHSALFSFYGIKTNNLQNAVWANALSTTGSSSGDGSSSDGSSTDGTSSPGGGIRSGVHTQVWCERMVFTANYSGNATAGAAGTYTAPGGAVHASVKGGYVNSTSVTGAIAAHWAPETRCIGPYLDFFCSDVIGVKACTGQ